MNYLYPFLMFCNILVVNPGITQGTWQSVGPGDIPIYSFAVEDSFLFAGGILGFGGISRTADYGENWTPVNDGLPPNPHFVLSMISTDTAVYIGIGYQLWATKDLGNDWDFVNTQVTPQYSNVLGYAGEPWNVMYAGGGTQAAIPAVMISPDGANWSLLNNGLPTLGGVYTMMAHDSSLYAGTYRGVFRYDYNSSSWKQSNTGLSFYEVFSLAKNENYFFAGTRYHGVFRSIDGESWTRINTGLDTMQSPFNAFAFYGSEIYVAASGNHGGVYKSSDQGDHWIANNDGLPEDVDVYNLIIQPPYLLAGTEEHGVYRLDSLISATTSYSDVVSLVVKPNPNIGEFSVQLDLPHPINLILTLTDLVGQPVFSSAFESSAGVLDIPLHVEKLTAGIYFLRVSGKGIDVVEKVIIQ